MYCRNCGNEMNHDAAFCTKCGTPVGNGNGFCSTCGQEMNQGSVICPRCGTIFSQYSGGGTGAQAPYGAAAPMGNKSELCAGLLGIFLGGWGVHNFYLGYTKKAVIQLLLGTVGIAACCIGPTVSSIWGLVEGIMILTGSINTDGNGNRLVK